jgi:hypothetical protein
MWQGFITSGGAGGAFASVAFIVFTSQRTKKSGHKDRPSKEHVPICRVTGICLL